MDNVVVLIADDAAFMRKMLRMVLTEAGIKDFLEASDGQSAINLYKAQQPSLVLLDITMVGKTGLEALQEIMEYDPEAKVVMCSAIGQETVIMEAIRMGALDYIIKPFQKDKLIEVIQNLL